MTHRWFTTGIVIEIGILNDDFVTRYLTGHRIQHVGLFSLVDFKCDSLMWKAEVEKSSMGTVVDHGPVNWNRDGVPDSVCSRALFSKLQSIVASQPPVAKRNRVNIPDSDHRD